MDFFKAVDAFANIGAKKNYKPWEIHLTRRLNFSCIMGAANVLVAIIFLSFINNTLFHVELLITLLVSPFVVILNRVKSYIWAGYLFYLIGVFLLYTMTLKMGIDSFVIMFYFPIFIGLIQVFGRKETLFHLLTISTLFFISIIFLVVGYKDNFLRIAYSIETVEMLRNFNIISSFSLTIVLISWLSYENVRQETIIIKAIHEKDVLLAEVFHRVKNNMNIVTSLLNLKKHSSKSEEVKVALEECRERVFSMALVHQKIYSNQSIDALNFKEYIDDLVKESVNSIGGSQKVDVILHTENIDLPLLYAIPSGLILNELITNSFKHAQTPDKKLRIEIELKRTNQLISLNFKDNGPGYVFTNDVQSESLGLDLIKSLCEQIDGKYKVFNQDGFKFEMQFSRN